MSKMSQIHLEVTELLEAGLDIETIAQVLKLPVDLIECLTPEYEEMEDLITDDDEDWEASLDALGVSNNQPVL